MNQNFQKVNNLVGWIIFAIALITYWATMEPTASYWDAGEFIAVSYKLQVPHPPGAPFFLLLGRLFSFLSFGDTTMVAYWINFISVLAGAFTNLFLFWSIVLFGRKIMKINKPEELTTDKTWVLIGAGIVGALSYTFCDSQWFSAVESEVYSMSSFFTAFVVWAMLKWDVIEDEAKANRWLLLIFYMMGLSIGVHLLNLVTIPALALIYYFKKHKAGTWGIVATMLISLLIIFFINSIIIPGLPSMAGNFEIFFVNTMGLPFGSGAIFFALILLAALIFGIRYSQVNQKPILNTFLLATAFILIGYSSYAMIVIRSNFNPPINQNDPSDVMSFVRYLKREQYGSRPLLYGQYFTAQVVGYDEGEPRYVKGKDKYEVAERSVTYKFSPKDQTILPRIYSTDPDHQKIYRETLGLREGEKPNFVDNISFMFSHQIGWMYIRYFMFNFAGRESDNQGADWMRPSNWFEKLPPSLAENKGRNNFFMIPFILGLIGIFYQSVNSTKNFIVISLLFVLTGVALVIYLNSPPTEPRERDYIYTGSYYAFSFWIGFAVIALADWITKLTKNLKTSAVIATALCFTAPVLMAKDGWDDHNRSGRYFSVDSAINYLQSCAPNAILFTGGDNDTFPLWYSQEVEGVRTDVRVIVLSYYNTDWYINQTMRQTYESKPFPYTLTSQNYKQGGPNDYLPFYDANIKNVDLKQYLELLKKEHKGLRLYPTANAIPTRELILKVDVEKVRSLGIVPKNLDSLIVPEMRLRVKGNGLEKKDLAMLDVLATADWERPLYVNNTSLAQLNIDLSRFVVQEGNAYRILPVFNPNPDVDLVNTDASYENMMKKFQFRGLDDENAYFTQDYRSFVQNHRSSLNSLAEALIDEGDTTRAREVLLYSLAKMPDKGVRYDFTNVRMIELLFEVGEKQKALEIANTVSPRFDENAAYYIRERQLGREFQINLMLLGELQRVLYANGEADLAKKIEDAYTKHGEAFQNNRGGVDRQDF
jgi:MFS family permease